jgi:signal transduction histidine kinase
MAADIDKGHLSIRGRLAAVATVLVVMLPLVIFVYTYSVRRDFGDRLVAKQLDESLKRCYALRNRVEHGLQEAHRLYFPGVPPDAPGADEADLFLYRQRYLEGMVKDWLDEIASRDEVVTYAIVVDQRGVVMTPPGGATPQPALIEARYGEEPEAVLQRLLQQVATHPTNLYPLFIPAKVGGRYVGGIHFGLAVDGITAKAQRLVAIDNVRLLRMALFVTAFLALLAAYVVRLNDQTRELQSQLEQEKQMGSVGRLAAGLAHEIRTPLNALQMNLQMLHDRLGEMQLEDGEYIKRRLDYIHRTAARLEVSVDDFLALARPPAPQKTPADINHVVDDVVEFLRAQCTSEGIGITKHYDETLPPLSVDVSQIGQTMQNLIRNARQAVNGQGGRIAVSTARAGRYVEIRVADNGPGVPLDARERIFDVFYTTKPDGTGLGLSIVKRILEAHHGDILVGDAPGGGAEFTVRLPIDTP